MMSKPQKATNADIDEQTMSNLLVPGHAGELNHEELAFIKASLKADRRLRSLWRLGRRTGRLNDEKIRRIALEGVQKASSEDSEAVVQIRPNSGKVQR